MGETKMAECAGHYDTNCRRDLSEKMDEKVVEAQKCFIKKPGAAGRWLIGGVCSILLLISASLIGFSVHYVQAQGEKIYDVDKTQAKMASGFQNISEAVKKLADVTGKLGEAMIRNEERIEAESTRSKKADDTHDKRLNRTRRQP